jgi:hypothetical protein
MLRKVRCFVGDRLAERRPIVDDLAAEYRRLGAIFKPTIHNEDIEI